MLVEIGRDFLGDHLAHRAGEAIVDAFIHPHRLGGNEVATGHAHETARHRCVRQPLGELGFDLDAGHRHRRLDAFKGLRIGHAQAFVKARHQAPPGHFGIDLGPCAMHQHQAHAERGQQVAVVGQFLAQLANGNLAPETEHESLASKGVDVGCGSPHPGNETLGKLVCRQGHGRVFR